MLKPKYIVSAWISKSIYDWLNMMAEKEDRSLSYLVTRILAQTKYREEQELLQKQQTLEITDESYDDRRCGNCNYLQQHGEDYWCTKRERPTSLDFMVCNVVDWQGRKN